MKINGYRCNLCDQHIKDDDGMIVTKVRRRWYLWMDSGWSRETVHICRNCQEKIRDYFQPKDKMQIHTNLFDGEEIHPDCTVQVLTNSVTGEVSIGWWENHKGEDRDD